MTAPSPLPRTLKDSEEEENEEGYSKDHKHEDSKDKNYGDPDNEDLEDPDTVDVVGSCCRGGALTSLFS